MAHAGTKTPVKAMVEVAQGFVAGLAQVGAAGQKGCQRRRQGIARASKSSVEKLESTGGNHGLGRCQHVFNELLGQRDARYQRVGHAHLGGCGCDVAWTGVSVAVPVGQKPTPQRAVVSNQHRGLGQQELTKSVQILINQVVLPPGKVGHVADHGQVRVVRRQLGNGADVFGATHKTHLDHLYWKVFQCRPRLVSNSLVVQGEMVENLGRITYVGPSDHGHRVPAHRCHGGNVGGQPASPAGVAGIEQHHAGRVDLGLCVGGQAVIREEGGRLEWHGPVAVWGWRKSGNQHRCLDTIVAFYVKAP